MNWSNRKKLAFCVIGLALAYGIAWINEVKYQEQGRIYPNNYNSWYAVVENANDIKSSDH